MLAYRSGGPNSVSIVKHFTLLFFHLHYFVPPCKMGFHGFIPFGCPWIIDLRTFRDDQYVHEYDLLSVKPYRLFPADPANKLSCTLHQCDTSKVILNREFYQSIACNRRSNTTSVIDVFHDKFLYLFLLLIALYDQ